MKKIMVLAVIFAVMLVIPAVSHAEKGVGIKWYTEAEIIPEESTRCIRYGVYNPWSEDVNAILRASDEFAPVLEKQLSEPIFVQAHTASSAALDSNICFKISDVYAEDCLIGNWFCSRVCPGDDSRQKYSGQVIVEGAPKDANLGGGMGSGTVFGVAAPLRVIIGCTSAERDLIPLVYVIILIIAIIVIIIALRKRKMHGKKEKKAKSYSYKHKKK